MSEYRIQMSDESVSRPRRFRAKIRRQGVNPYVDVPSSVSRAFGAYARDGRIAVRVRLNGHEVLGTLIPVRAGAHRFFVNGGLRAAAGVDVGDTVAIELRATNPDDVHPAADVRQALRARGGALAAFDNLSPSHRRQLLRYIDDARTPAGRTRRIAKTMDHLLGESTVVSRRPAPPRALWRCPRCGNEFVNRNQYHSCKRYDLDALFAGKSPEIRSLYDRFHEMVQRCGPSKVLPYRDKVAYMVRVRFAGAAPATRWLDVGFWLPRRVDSPRFRKIETIYPNAHAHLLRVTDPSQLDAEVAEWLAEAYEVGCQHHLR
jgi:hypothetical protein